MQVTIKDGNLIIATPVNVNPTEADRSGSGKSLVVATTAGIVKSNVTVQGKTVSIGVNAFIKA